MASKHANRAKRTVTNHKPGKNGRVLTAKNLPEKDYRTVHEAPHGTRQMILHGLLAAATVFAAKDPNWIDHIQKGKIKLVRA